ncbi:hypothetical protein GIB67_010389 [Kingdonia uniflora]|uniref:Aminotransferase-like plant mobile domain-containing protein n=1 Tax=Kingdonia uniflora TaxID=39325 RepID=A0A7J7MAA1_9MAGN|nr:hypothetical protein GIB67_010389 [Kingdonia uniflora]
MSPKQKVPKKIRPTASHQKRSITDPTRAEESGSVPQVAVTPEEVQDVESPSTSGGDSQASVSSKNYFYPNATSPARDTPQYEPFLNPAVEVQEQGTKTTDEEGIQDDNNDDSSESEVDEYGPWGTSLLTSIQTHKAKTLALGQDLGCLRVFHHSPTWDIGKKGEKVPTLVELQGLGRIRAISYTLQRSIDYSFRRALASIDQQFSFQIGRDYYHVGRCVEINWVESISLSLVKIVDFFASKVGTNTAAEASSSSEPPRLSSRAVAKAYMLYVLGAFLFPKKKGTDVSPKFLNFYESKNSDITWSWGATTLAYLYYSLGTFSRVNAKALACCTTLLESWIFKHFPKLPGIPKPNDSRAPEYCTRWSWSRTTSERSRQKALKIFRESLDNYKLEDYEWADLFSEGKWKESLITARGRKVHDGISACVEGYFEWFKEVSFTKLCPSTVNLDEMMMGGYWARVVVGVLVLGVLFGGGGVGSLVGGDVGGGFSQCEHVQCQNEDIIFRLEEEISNLKLEKETDEYERLKESNDSLKADLQAKQVVDSICGKDFIETKKKLNDNVFVVCFPLVHHVYHSLLSVLFIDAIHVCYQNLECSSLKETNKLSKDVSSLKKKLADLNLQLQKIGFSPAALSSLALSHFVAAIGVIVLVSDDSWALVVAGCLVLVRLGCSLGLLFWMGCKRRTRMLQGTVVNEV